MLDGTARQPLASLLGVAPDLALADPALRRSPAEGNVGAEARALYADLCRLAGYDAA